MMPVITIALPIRLFLHASVSIISHPVHNQMLTSLLGITSFLVLRMWFGKAVEDFNRDISEEGSSAPQLIASTSNGFISE